MWKEWGRERGRNPGQPFRPGVSGGLLQDNSIQFSEFRRAKRCGTLRGAIAVRASYPEVTCRVPHFWSFTDADSLAADDGLSKNTHQCGGHRVAGRGFGIAGISQIRVDHSQHVTCSKLLVSCDKIIFIVSISHFAQCVRPWSSSALSKPHAH
jgi:hypothetical protein